jgi:hypothetical protein
MSKMPSPRADRLREMREAAYETEQARQAAERIHTSKLASVIMQLPTDATFSTTNVQLCTKRP